MNILGVEPWAFEQRLGEAVFIPAGCPHQVRNLKVSTFFPFHMSPATSPIQVLISSHREL